MGSHWDPTEEMKEMAEEREERSLEEGGQAGEKVHRLPDFYYFNLREV